MYFPIQSCTDGFSCLLKPPFGCASCGAYRVLLLRGLMPPLGAWVLGPLGGLQGLGRALWKEPQRAPRPLGHVPGLEAGGRGRPAGAHKGHGARRGGPLPPRVCEAQRPCVPQGGASGHGAGRAGSPGQWELRPGLRGRAQRRKMAPARGQLWGGRLGPGRGPRSPPPPTPLPETTHRGLSLGVRSPRVAVGMSVRGCPGREPLRVGPLRGRGFPLSATPPEGRDGVRAAWPGPMGLSARRGGRQAGGPVWGRVVLPARGVPALRWGGGLGTPPHSAGCRGARGGGGGRPSRLRPLRPRAAPRVPSPRPALRWPLCLLEVRVCTCGRASAAWASSAILTGLCCAISFFGN